MRTKLKTLVDDYFWFNSSPSDVDALCNLMSEDISAVYVRGTVHGIDAYRQHVTETLESADCLSEHEVEGMQYDFFINQDGEFVGKVTWIFYMRPRPCCSYFCICCCCLLPLCFRCCREFRKKGVNTYKFAVDDTDGEPKISFVMTEYD